MRRPNTFCPPLCLSLQGRNCALSTYYFVFPPLWTTCAAGDRLLVKDTTALTPNPSVLLVPLTPTLHFGPGVAVTTSTCLGTSGTFLVSPTYEGLISCKRSVSFDIAARLGVDPPKQILKRELQDLVMEGLEERGMVFRPAQPAAETVEGAGKEKTPCPKNPRHPA